MSRAYSGHDAYGGWGPPRDGSAPVVAVGLRPAVAADRLAGCREVARISNGDGVDHEERGRPVLVCDGPRRPWSREWASLRHLG